MIHTARPTEQMELKQLLSRQITAMFFLYAVQSHRNFFVLERNPQDVMILSILLHNTWLGTQTVQKQVKLTL